MVSNYDDLKKLSMASNSFSRIYDDLIKMERDRATLQSSYSASLFTDQFKALSLDSSQANHYILIKKQQSAIFQELSLVQKTIQATNPSKSYFEDISLLSSIKKLVESSRASEALRATARFDYNLNKLVNTDLILSSSLKTLIDEGDFIKRSYFPRIGITSVLALNSLRVYEDIKAQLEILDLQHEDLTLQNFSKESESKLVSFDYWTHIYFIISILLFLYQTNDSEMMEKRISKKIDKNATEIQKKIQHVEKLLENVVKANQYSIVSGVEYIVKNRNTKVRSLPQSGSKVIAEIYPNQVVKLLDADGKWIEVEYYDWLQMQPATGWVMKKYLKRIEPLVAKAAQDNPDLPIDFVRDLLIAKAQSKNELTPFEPENLN